jgi:radical SAM superfamily enzyme
MEIDYLNGELAVYETMEDYIQVLAGFLERLRPDIVIQRLMGEGKVGELVAPEWADTHRFKGNKNKFLELLEKSQSHVKTLD